MKKTLLFVFAAFALTAVLVSYNGCSKKPVKPPIITVTGVSLNKTTLSLTVGGKETLTVTITPANATDKTVTWASDNAAVATVNSSTGEVTAISVGSAKITATSVSGSKTASCTITVTAATVAVTGVTLNKTTASLSVGSKETLVATVAPTNATTKTVTWTSDNTAVATVNATTGEVTAVSAGSAKITATSTSGSKTASCTVTVADLIKSISVTTQSGTLTTGTAGTATFAVTTANIADGKTGSVTWYTTAAGTTTGTAPVGIIATVSNTASNKATITVAATAATAIGTYWFKTTIDGTTSGVVVLTVTGTAVNDAQINNHADWRTLTVDLGKVLSVTVTPLNATNKTVTLSSDNTAVVTVNSSTGELRGISIGRARITITSNSNPSVTHSYTVDVVPSIGWVTLQPGTFQMGSPASETDRVANETQHSVTLTKMIRMGRYEVTNAEYVTYLNALGYGVSGTGETHAKSNNGDILIYDSAKRNGGAANWGITWDSGTNKWKVVPGYEDHPVIYVTWYGAKLFAEWVGGRLPTEAEWEYGCRGGTTVAYSFIYTTNAADYAWYSANSGNKTQRVGQKAYNLRGLFDIQGNVREWCQDSWDGTTAYSSASTTDPLSTIGNNRVVRGASITYDLKYLRSAYRMSELPGTALPALGFRVVFDW